MYSSWHSFREKIAARQMQDSAIMFINQKARTRNSKKKLENYKKAHRMHPKYIDHSKSAV